MLLKQGRPETDEFERKENFGCKGKYIEILGKTYFPDILNTFFLFVYYLVSKHFYFEIFFNGGSFDYVLPKAKNTPFFHEKRS